MIDFFKLTKLTLSHWPAMTSQLPPVLFRHAVACHKVRKASLPHWRQNMVLVLLVLLFSGRSLQADSTQAAPVGFQYEVELTEGKTSLRRAELSWEILTGIRQQGQTDLRVYNADNQLMPFSVRQRNVEDSAGKTEKRELNFFSGDNAQHLEQLLANQQTISNRDIKALSANNRHYLIIPTAVRDGAVGLTSLALEWKELRQWLPKSLRVDSSDDLLQWRSLKLEQLPYVLNERGVILENRLIRLQQPVQAKFIRLSGGQDFAVLLPALHKVAGYYQARQQQPLTHWQTVALSPSNKLQRYHYDPPPAVALTQWRLALPQPGYMYAGKVYSRRPSHRPAVPSAQQSDQPQSDWRYRQRFQQYHLQTAAGVVRSAAEPVASLANQQWLLEFEQPLTGETAPELEVAWQPLDIYFIAQGNGPFRLVYGSRRAEAVPAMQLDNKLMAEAESVQLKQVVMLKTAGDEQQPVNWLAWLLWAVLAVSVVFLLWMAKSLWSEMNRK